MCSLFADQEGDGAGGPPCVRGGKVIKPQDNPWDFIKPPFKVSSAPGKQGNWGRNLCHWRRGRWRGEAEEDSSSSDLWFPLLNRGVGGGVRCCLGYHRCAGSVCGDAHIECCWRGASYDFLNNHFHSVTKHRGRYCLLQEECLAARLVTVCGCRWSNKPREGYKTEWSKTSIIFCAITSATRCSSGTGTCLHQRKGYRAFTAFHFLISRFMFNLFFLSVEPNTAVRSNKLSMQGAFFHFFSKYLTCITACWALSHTHTHTHTHTHMCSHMCSQSRTDTHCAWVIKRAGLWGGLTLLCFNPKKSHFSTSHSFFWSACHTYTKSHMWTQTQLLIQRIKGVYP